MVHRPCLRRNMTMMMRKSDHHRRARDKPNFDFRRRRSVEAATVHQPKQERRGAESVRARRAPEVRVRKSAVQLKARQRSAVGARSSQLWRMGFCAELSRCSLTKDRRPLPPSPIFCLTSVRCRVLWLVGGHWVSLERKVHRRRRFGFSPQRGFTWGGNADLASSR